MHFCAVVGTHLDVLVLQGFHIEPNGGNCLHRFVAFVLQSVQYGCFPSIIQAQNQNANFLRAEQAIEEFAHHDAHRASVLLCVLS